MNIKQTAQIYGEYQISVLNENGNYYPFGESYKKNLILDQFLAHWMTGVTYGLPHYMLCCLAGSGTGAALRTDTTGTFGPPLDVTCGGTYWITGGNTGINSFWMHRDFIFPTLNSEKTYSNAMIGSFLTGTSLSNFDTTMYLRNKDVALSEFTFPYPITLFSGDALKINYRLNFIVNYLSTGARITGLTGEGFNFNGALRIAGTNENLFNLYDPLESTPGIIRYVGESANTLSYIDKTITNTGQIIVSNAGIGNDHRGSTRAPAIFCQNTGWQSDPQGNFPQFGFLRSGFVPRFYPLNINRSIITGDIVDGVSKGKRLVSFVINDTGAYATHEMFLGANISSGRNVTGIALSFRTRLNSENAGTMLLFDNIQTVPQFVPIYLRYTLGFTR